eukprot:4222791-Amphidinium_carterae.1
MRARFLSCFCHFERFWNATNYIQLDVLEKAPSILMLLINKCPNGFCGNARKNVQDPPEEEEPSCQAASCRAACAATSDAPGPSEEAGAEICAPSDHQSLCSQSFGMLPSSAKMPESTVSASITQIATTYIYATSTAQAAIDSATVES